MLEFHVFDKDIRAAMEYHKYQGQGEVEKRNSVACFLSSEAQIHLAAYEGCNEHA